MTDDEAMRVEMAPRGQLQEPKIGENIKVHLPGESPWAECISLREDGTWEGRITNRLFTEMSELEQARYTNTEFGRLGKVSPPHHFKQNDIVQFMREVTADYEIWVPFKPAEIDPARTSTVMPGSRYMEGYTNGYKKALADHGLAEVNLPFQRVPVCGCDLGRGNPPSRGQMAACRLRGGPCCPDFYKMPEANTPERRDD